MAAPPLAPERPPQLPYWTLSHRVGVAGSRQAWPLWGEPLHAGPGRHWHLWAPREHGESWEGLTTVPGSGAWPRAPKTHRRHSRAGSRALFHLVAVVLQLVEGADAGTALFHDTTLLQGPLQGQGLQAACTRAPAQLHLPHCQGVPRRAGSGTAARQRDTGGHSQGETVPACPPALGRTPTHLQPGWTQVRGRVTHTGCGPTGPNAHMSYLLPPPRGGVTAGA